MAIVCDEFHAFPPGVPQTSKAVCECEPGRSKDGQDCKVCQKGSFKASVGNGMCTAAPQPTPAPKTLKCLRQHVGVILC